MEKDEILDFTYDNRNRNHIYIITCNIAVFANKLIDEHSPLLKWKKTPPKEGNSELLILNNLKQWTVSNIFIVVPTTVKIVLKFRTLNLK